VGSAGRIAYLLTAYPTITETFVEGEFRVLANRGMPIDLYATRNFRELVGEDPDPDHGLSINRLPYFWSWEVWGAAGAFLATRPLRTLAVFLRVLSGNARSPRFLMQTVALFPKTLAFARRMERRGTAHVHGTWGHYPATCAYVASRLLKVPFSFSAHAGLDVYADQTFLSQKTRSARFVLTCMEGNRRLLAEIAPEASARIHTVYHGVTLAAIPPAGTIPRANPPEIVSAGRLVREKGFLDLVAACGLLSRRGVVFRLRIFGDGPERSRLEEAIRNEKLEEIVVLEGFAPHRNMLEAAARATVVALASVQSPNKYLDGMANVLVEAMACGTAVVCTAYSGSRELLLDGKAGLLVPQHDPPRLAEALETLLTRPETREELQRAGRERALADFVRERNVERIEALFRKSLERPAPEA
jgi:glycosyltransferase involved in cell wall biosynthesis